MSNNTNDSIAVSILVGVFVIGIIGLAVVLGGLLTLLAWNVGVVGIVAAAGGSVGKIGLGIAICANIAIGIVGRIFRPRAEVKTST